MLFTQSLLALALQVGPNPAVIPPTDAHRELRERPPREQHEQAALDPASAWLAQCLATIEEDASRAHTRAQIRRNESTGADRVIANHCLGLAAARLRLWDDAMTAFEAARDETPANEPRARARFAIMAGNAALGGGDAVRADRLLASAVADAETAASATLHAIAATDHARALVALDRPGEALVRLETATALAPERAEGWLLRATLLRRLDRLGEAQGAIETAGQLAPLDQRVGLEAGIIALFDGREEAARESWQSVIALDPDTQAAATARDYLAQIGADEDTAAPVSAEPAS
ncbi:hypothetical protein [Qipengyuania nanhaisediminis]|uniref:hypothetical protein n=1 Tax=Qipengyuania nanhaisediminis TaxID=604088 RepID=UPI0038B2597B